MADERPTAPRQTVRVHRDVTGALDAPALVLSNSLGTTLEMWEPQVDALSGRYRVVRYDSRGHGRSGVPPGPYDLADLGRDLLALLDDLDIASAHLCGLSLGGLTSLWVAAHAPERVLSLAVLSAPARFRSADTYRQRAALVRSEGTSAIADGVVARWFTPGFATDHPGVAPRFTAMISGVDRDGYASCCEAVAAADLTASLQSIRVPVLCLAGAADPALPVTDVAALAAALPDGRLRVIEGAAHLLNVERPAEATSLIVEHIEAARAPVVKPR